MIRNKSVIGDRSSRRKALINKTKVDMYRWINQRIESRTDWNNGKTLDLDEQNQPE